MAAQRFVPIVRKVNIIILLSLVVAIGAVTFYFAQRTVSTMGSATRVNLEQQSDILTASIQNAMLQGEAPLVVLLFQGISDTNPTYDIALYRQSGQQAFSDNATISTVNGVRAASGLEGGFAPRTQENPNAVVIRDRLLEASVSGLPSTQFQQLAEPDGTHHFRILRPLYNLPRCARCHGSTHTIRGVLDIRNDITLIVRRQRTALIVSGALFLAVVLLLAVVLSSFLRMAIIRPVKLIGEVCTSVTNGSFDRRVDIRTNDEIGVLGNTVNTMVQGLYERYELSKFVSASTLAALGDSQEGRKVRIAMLFTDVRGFTAYSERTDPSRVVERLNGLLSAQTDIIHRYQGDVDKYVGDEIVAIFSGAAATENACAAAIEIQREVLQESSSQFDGLKVGAGINTGEVILGMVGSQRRADYTIIGDNVNVASRLCDLASPGQVLISAAVHEEVRQIARAEGPIFLTVKGKSERLEAYSLRAIRRRVR